MRNAFCSTMTAMAAHPELVFLTGDLGYGALEPLREILADRFINAGVAEQNMVTVAAGLASRGFRPFVYSIAPFVYARPYEQIRVDVCLHKLPVTLVGNGGGYGYGVMGSTHHAIEDYGALLCLSQMQVYVPAFQEDVPHAISRIWANPKPSYLRLGRDERPKDFALPEYTPWRKLIDGKGCTIVVVGPLVGPLLTPLSELPVDIRPNLWIVSELPLDQNGAPQEFLDDVQKSGKLIVAEEHVAAGGFGPMLASYLLQAGIAPKKFVHRHAVGYISGRYGSQHFHRQESGLDAQSLLSDITTI